MAVLAKAVGHEGLVRGQYRDLHEGADRRGEDEIASANQQKTGALFAAALEIAACIAGAAADARQSLQAAAAEIGHAFQLRDVLEDSDDEAAGPAKDRHKDEGKSTLVALLGRDGATRRMHSHLAQAERHLREAFAHQPDATGLMLAAFGFAPRGINPRAEAHHPDHAAGSLHRERSTTRASQRLGDGLSARLW